MQVSPREPLQWREDKMLDADDLSWLECVVVNHKVGGSTPPSSKFIFGLQSTKRDFDGILILGDTVGDIIASVNGNKVTHGSDLYRILDQCKVGDKVWCFNALVSIYKQSQSKHALKVKRKK
ncbi:hypothetical protein MTR_6g007020 [Medicago truncatula]|uniref:PDZ domain-containing protein n=1 Tax=Medicago truncatula TaxID=3880 RepID=G7KIR5_MEDTR|nr:hypothetical protein MTR_6g007020 [Medicago truncatula]